MGGWGWAQYHSQGQARGLQGDGNLKVLNCLVWTTFYFSLLYLPSLQQSLRHSSFGQMVLWGMTTGGWFFFVCFFVSSLLEAVRSEKRQRSWLGRSTHDNQNLRGAGFQGFRDQNNACRELPLPILPHTPPPCPLPPQDSQKHYGACWTFQNKWDGDSFYLTAREE